MTHASYDALMTHFMTHFSVAKPGEGGVCVKSGLRPHFMTHRLTLRSRL